MKAFRHTRVYEEGSGIRQNDLLFNDRILALGEGDLRDVEIIPLPEDAVVLPGFIDEHIHGAGGADAMDGTHDALATIAKTLVKEGTTSFLATTMTQSVENIKGALAAANEYMKNPAKGAQLLGVHLEGPFISAKYKGAQPLEYVAKPSVETFDMYQKAAGGNIKIVTLAPEEEGAAELIAHLKEQGVIASIGHSGAIYDDVERAVKAGATHVTHTYNAQSPLHHREVGVVGSAMLFNTLSCELIADCIHVSVPAMRLLMKEKEWSRVILITDAIRAKGLGDGESELGGQKVFVKNGEARLADGTLAGSVLCMNRAIQNLVEKTKISLECAVSYATKRPALDLGIWNECGSIRKGKRADFTVLDSHYDVVMTIIGGEIVYHR